MVANNKNSVSSEGSSLPAAKVGDGGRPVRDKGLKLRRLPKKVIFIFIIAIVGIIIVVLAVNHHKPGQSQEIYAEVAGRKIYKKDVTDLIGTTQGITVHQGAVVLADKYLTEAMANQAGITISDNDVKAKFGDSVVRQRDTNRYLYQSDLNSIYFDKLSAYNTGLYRGQVIVANFSRHIAFQSPFLGIQKATDPLMGNAAAVAQDKRYASNFITDLYNQIKAHKITFDQAIQKERSDLQLGMQAYQTLPHSGSFDTSNVYLPATALVLPQSIKGKIHGMKAGQISAPFVVSVNNSLTKKNVMTDSYYLIVKMDSTKGGSSSLTYAQYLSQAKQELGYKIYV
jgi:hypothetical protein